MSLYLKEYDSSYLFFRDTLFFEDFSLSGIIDHFISSCVGKEEGALVSCYKCKDEGEASLLAP